VLDADPQESLTKWLALRGDLTLRPVECDDGNIVRAIRSARGLDWLFIDTPPYGMDVIETAIAAADATLVPVKVSVFDLASIQDVIEMCKEHRKPFAFVLADVDTRFKTEGHALAALKGMGPVLKTHFTHRKQWSMAPIVGKAGHEIAKALRPEIDALWAEVQALAEGGHRS
jgi:chromosome partitioning protein